MTFDVAIVGAPGRLDLRHLHAALAGLRVLVLDRELFPREKVCGDCLNPGGWVVLERLSLAAQVRALPHGQLDSVQFIAIGGQTVSVDLPSGAEGEIAVKRSLFDHLLLHRAREAGAAVHEDATVTALQKDSSSNWQIETVRDKFTARTLIGADGRNSTVARLCNLLPRPQRERVALQSHLPIPAGFGIVLFCNFYAVLGQRRSTTAIECVPGRKTSQIDALEWAQRNFMFRPTTPGAQSAATRAPITTAHDNLLFIGDAARVMEPFTGEGIYYALRSGELAATAIARLVRGEDRASTLREFNQAHASMYRGRLWINRLARAAVLSPRVASFFVHLAKAQPSILRLLTSKIVRL
jgi:flavin-dependent dehydrogenase